MKNIIILILTTASITFPQIVYEVTPGTKGNEIKLTVANISELNPAEGVEIKLVKSSSSLSFTKETETIELIEPAKEEQAAFKFDINRNAPVNLPTGQAGKRDTVEFLITDNSSIYLTKQFIFNYTPPKEFKLEQNFPNPFNPTTTIQYQLPADSKVTLKVYDILGSEVATLIDKEQEAGFKEVQFNGSSYASGMYIYRLTSGSFSSIKKMLIIN